jgi:hypothetical protein
MAQRTAEAGATLLKKNVPAINAASIIVTTFTNTTTKQNKQFCLTRPLF